jgi:hypothetical protein
MRKTILKTVKEVKKASQKFISKSEEMKMPRIKTLKMVNEI